jgi:PAS domain S-box-containing protein
MAQKSFAEVLRQLRHEKGISQEDLSLKADLHRTYVSLLERELRTPSLKTVVKICRVLEITPADMMDLLDGKAMGESQGLREINSAENDFFSFVSESSGILFLDPQGTIVEANEKVCEDLSTNKSLVIGKTLEDLVQPSERDKMGAFFSKLFDGGTEICEFSMSGSLPGLTVPVIVAATVQYSPTKNINGVIVVITDISAQVKIEEDLRKSEANLRSVFDRFPASIMTINEEGMIRFVNRGFGNWSIEQLLGKHIEFILSGEYSELFSGCFEKCFLNKTAETVESSWGSQSVYETQFIPVNVFGGEPQVMVICTDITEEKRMAEELRRNDAIRDTVVSLVKRFFQSRNPDSDIHQVLAEMGRALDVSRVYIFEKHFDDNNKVLVTQNYEWAADGIDSQIKNPEMTDFSFEDQGMGHWIDSLSRNQACGGVVKDLSSGEKAVFESQNIVSIICVPIMVDDVWWGFIGIDDCVRERIWSESEVSVLKISANVIGAAIQYSRIEEELRNREKHNRVVLETMAEGLVFSDTQGNVIFANDEACRIFDIERASFIEDHFEKSAYELLNEYGDVLPQEETVWAQVIRTKAKVLHVERGIRKQSGAVVWLSVSGSPVIDTKGNVEGVVMTYVDITKKRKMESELREGETRLNYLIDSTEDLILVVDREKKIRYAKIPKRYGIKGNELIGSTLEPFFEPAEALKIKEGIQSVFKTGEPVLCENRLIWRGEEIWFSDYILPIRDEAGRIRSVAKICRNITSLKRAEQQNIELNRTLQDAQMHLNRLANYSETQQKIETRLESLQQKVVQLQGSWDKSSQPADLFSDIENEIKQMMEEIKS